MYLIHRRPIISRALPTYVGIGGPSRTPEAVEQPVNNRLS
jgi:hypothetical protein